MKKSMTAVAIAAAFVVALGVTGCSSNSSDSASGSASETTSGGGGRTADAAGTLTYKGDVKEPFGGKTTSLDGSISFASMICTVKDGKISTATASNIKLRSWDDVKKIGSDGTMLSYTDALQTNLVADGIVANIQSGNVTLTDSTLAIAGDSIDITYVTTGKDASLSTGSVALQGTLTCTTILEK